jgi:hypothetical protein
MNPILRPPRLFRFGGKRFIFAKGKATTIDSNLSDDELYKIFKNGTGKNPDQETQDPFSHKGSYDDEINDFAKKLGLFKKGYLGTFSIDKIHEIAKLVHPGIKQFGFIFNTDPSYKKGQHWIAVTYVAKNKELDYYNSLGEDPTDEFLRQIKPVIDKLALPELLKFKINKIPRQGASMNCGYHSLMFIYDILIKGLSYKFSTGYSDIKNGEKDISDFKDGLKKEFDYI